MVAGTDQGGLVMKQRATKYSTTYSRDFSEKELRDAAKATFILDLGGAEGMAKRGLKMSAIKIHTLGALVRCSVTSMTCQIDSPNPLVFAEFPPDSEGL